MATKWRNSHVFYQILLHDDFYIKLNKKCFLKIEMHKIYIQFTWTMKGFVISLKFFRLRLEIKTKEFFVSNFERQASSNDIFGMTHWPINYLLFKVLQDNHVRHNGKYCISSWSWHCYTMPKRKHFLFLFNFTITNWILTASNNLNERTGDWCFRPRSA